MMDVGAWDRRISRADLLAAENGPAASLLVFYARLLRAQKSAYEAFGLRRPGGSVDADAILVAHHGRSLLDVVAADSPDQLAVEARALLDASEDARADMLLAYWRDRADRRFFGKALFQPYAQFVADAGIEWA